MIDVIFELIMKQARIRPGKDLAVKIQDVLLEVDTKVIAAMEVIAEEQRREKLNEDKRSNNRPA
ncbi:hypothetical protein ES703_80244 [subsurface metagenome]